MSVHRLNTAATRDWHRQKSPVGQAHASLRSEIPARSTEAQVNSFGDVRMPRERGQDADAIGVRAAWDRMSPTRQAQAWAGMSQDQRAGLAQALAWSHRIGLAEAGQARRDGEAAEPIDQEDAYERTVTQISEDEINDEDWDWYGC